MAQTAAIRHLETEEDLLAHVRQGAMPRHIAIIMDGNGRWAQRQGQPRIAGHQVGADSVRQAVKTCRTLGVETLTLYTFSVENWRRPQEEVDALMFLIEHVIRREIAELHEAGVRLGVLGRLHEVPCSLQEELQRDIHLTQHNTGLLLNLAINYGGRAEIVDAVRSLAAKARAGILDPEAIDEQAISLALYTRALPDPDLLIRTAGEMRISNFLLWQAAYTEWWVTDILWPDFTRRHLLEAIASYQRRERRFGQVLGA